MKNISANRPRRLRVGLDYPLMDMDRSLRMLARHFDHCLRALKQPELGPGKRTVSSEHGRISPKAFTTAGN